MTKLEQCARALCEASGEQWRLPIVDSCNNHWRYKARAVLTALRDPTPEMLSAGAQEFAMTFQRGNTAEAHAASILKAMITAALNEGEG